MSKSTLTPQELLTTNIMLGSTYPTEFPRLKIVARTHKLDNESHELRSSYELRFNNIPSNDIIEDVKSFISRIVDINWTGSHIERRATVYTEPTKV